MALSSEKAFTLIELLVVIAIIGILSAFGLVAISDAKESARDSRRVSDLSQIRLALQLYYEDYEQFPVPITAGGNGPDISFEVNSALYSVDGSIFSDNNNPLVPDHVAQVLLDPLNNDRYHYFYDTNQNNGHQNYILCFYKESVNYTSRYFTSEGVFAEGDKCSNLTLPYGG
jgi:prepilin-type N-terminal cleavage/methylation domain-containing protein